jgi:hypothetical protein
MSRWNYLSEHTSTSGFSETHYPYPQVSDRNDDNRLLNYQCIRRNDHRLLDILARRGEQNQQDLWQFSPEKESKASMTEPSDPNDSQKKLVQASSESHYLDTEQSVK